MSTAVPAVLPDGHPDIALLADVLFTYGYVPIIGRHRDNLHVVRFALPDAGRAKLRDARAWRNGLSFWQRLRVRLVG